MQSYASVLEDAYNEVELIVRDYMMTMVMMSLLLMMMLTMKEEEEEVSEE